MKCGEQLSEEERRALRGSKFAPLPPSLPSTSRLQPRLAHPGGPLKTNKAAALAKFLERKLQEDPIGLATIDPDVLQLAVQNAKASVLVEVETKVLQVFSCKENLGCDGTTSPGGTSNSGTTVRHVDSFDESKDCSEEENPDISQPKKRKKKKKKKMTAMINAEKMKKNKKKKKKQKKNCGVIRERDPNISPCELKRASHRLFLLSPKPVNTSGLIKPSAG